jgi:ribokinase
MDKNLVTVVGSLNYDLIIEQDRVPRLGETFRGNDLKTAAGGKGANQAAQCGKLGLNTYLVGCVGNDIFADTLLTSLKESNVNTSYIKTSDTKTGMGIVQVMPDGDYFSTILPGANYRITKEDILKAEEIISQSKIVILQFEIPKELIELTISLANKHNCYIIFNPAPVNEIKEDYLNMVDCLVLNETEAEFFYGKEVNSVNHALDACEAMYPRIKDRIIITLGEKGSVYFDGQSKDHIPAETVNAVDATGAGDSFIGALAYSIYHDYKITDALSLSSHVSARSVTKIGGQPSFPFINEIEGFLDNL